MQWNWWRQEMARAVIVRSPRPYNALTRSTRFMKSFRNRRLRLEDAGAERNMPRVIELFVTWAKRNELTCPREH